MARSKSRVQQAEWTAEAELLALASTSSLPDACVALRIVEVAPAAVTLIERLAWARRGSETYTSAFDILDSDGNCLSTILFKAFVSVPMTGSAEGPLHRHLQNSAVLEAGGVRVPRVYGSRNGTAALSYVPFDLFDYVIELGTSDQLSRRLLRSAIVAARRVYELGYAPITGSLDFRTDGADVFLVDLGSDLGQPRAAWGSTSASSRASYVAKWAKESLRVRGVALSETVIKLVDG